MKFLIIGTATDGPDNEVRRPTSSTQLKQMYGGYYYETHSLSPSASSAVLDHEIFDYVSDSVVGLGVNQTYRPQFLGNTITFGPYGGTQNVEVTYRYRPYLGKSDLITAAESIFLDSGIWPDVCRVKGTVANLTVDDWTFKAKYSGAQYNSIIVGIGTDSLTVSGMGGYGVCTYDLTDIDTAVSRLQNDFDLDICPVYLSAFSNSLPSSGTYSLTGGGIGTLDDSSLAALFDAITIPPDITGVCVLGEWGSEFAQTVETYHSLYRPVFCLVGPTGSGYTTFETASATTNFYRHNMLGCVEGEVDIDINGSTKRRYAVEAIVGAMMRTNRLQITNIPLKVDSYYPTYSEEELDYLYEIGIMGLVRKIRAGVSVYKEITTGMDQDLLRSLIYSEVWARTSSYAHQYIGRTLPAGQNSKIALDVQNLIQDIDQFRVESVEAYVHDNIHSSRTYPLSGDTFVGSALFINVKGIVYDEILSINFDIKTQ